MSDEDPPQLCYLFSAGGYGFVWEQYLCADDVVRFLRTKPEDILSGAVTFTNPLDKPTGV